MVKILRSSGRCSLLVIMAAFAPACTTNVPMPGGGGSGGNNNPPGGGTNQPNVEATVQEQLALERVNRARLRPAAEAAANNIAIDEGVTGQLNTTPKQAVALNAKLMSAARQHSLDMLNRDFFEHNTPNGTTPFNRMTAAGYVYQTAGENLAWRGTTGTINMNDATEQQHVDLFVDSTVPGRGHRLIMLNGSFREVGIGVLNGDFTRNGTTYDSAMQTQDYGATATVSTFVLGVVYNDSNGNGRYDAGEGTPNSSVTLGTVTKLTNAGGGYGFEVLTAGTYNLRFASGANRDLVIDPGSPNLKVDLVGASNIVVNLGLGPLP